MPPIVAAGSIAVAAVVATIVVAAVVVAAVAAIAADAAVPVPMFWAPIRAFARITFFAIHFLMH